ncbi:Sporulation kinase E [Botrimarina colliarenosi]|uniref:histidine kinase n=1 Tax=Botrimarina colliarenosi TaxID=2528001 RepID=A0A5C6ALZ7_9BACT|nr:ATP-binding protein [Botrimarina colliarenosi]TWU00146.1 Sporulation kinase E [Botrimarina colliarenosi]
MSHHRLASWGPLGVLSGAVLGFAFWSLLDRGVGLETLHNKIDNAAVELRTATKAVQRLASGQAWDYDALTAASKRLRKNAESLRQTLLSYDPDAELVTVDPLAFLLRDIDEIEQFKTDHSVYRNATRAADNALRGLTEAFETESPSTAIDLLPIADTIHRARVLGGVTPGELKEASQELNWVLGQTPGDSPNKAVLASVARYLTTIRDRDAILETVAALDASVAGDCLEIALASVHHALTERSNNDAVRQRIFIVLLVAALTYGGLLINRQRQTAGELATLNAALERRVSERTQDLAAEHHLIESLITAAPNGVFWKDTNGVYLGCNRAYARLVEFDDEESIVGLSDEHLPWEDESRIKKLAIEEELLRSGEAVTNRVAAKRLKSGVQRELVVSKAALTGDDGSITGIVGVYTDVTELNRLRDRVQNGDRLQAVGQLAAGIAHEINTPIQCAAANLTFLRDAVATLLGIAESCQRDHHAEAPTETTRPAADWTRMLERLKQHAPAAIEESDVAIGRVTEIVRAMRVMSHPGTAAKELVDLNTLVESAATISRNRWKYTAELQLDLDPELPLLPVLTNDISQLVLNLIVNAADAITEVRAEDDPLGTIRVATRVESDGVLIEIADNGGGMTPEVKRRMYEQFFTTKEVGKGTGQGLAISHDIVVTKHGGRIECDSELGEGTTFRVWLPMADAPAEPESADERHEAVDDPQDLLAASPGAVY